MAINNSLNFKSSGILSFDVTVDAASLAGGGAVSLYVGDSGPQYRIRDLYISFGGTNFSGGGGDRDIRITDTNTDYSIIPAGTLIALVNGKWGDVQVPFPASAGFDTLTFPAGINLTARYINGTADYAAGSVTIS